MRLPTARLRPQVGSYFGSSLCALGGAGRSLLVGAPLYYDGRRGGTVHVYQWRGVSGSRGAWGGGHVVGAGGHVVGRVTWGRMGRVGGGSRDVGVTWWASHVVWGVTW